MKKISATAQAHPNIALAIVSQGTTSSNHIQVADYPRFILE
jgi:hypothetical protein